MMRIAESLIDVLLEEGKIDPDLLYQTARCSYFREHYAEAIFELRTALTLDKESYCSFDNRDNAQSLLNDCLECEELAEVLYTDEQREAVIEHVGEYFGSIERIFTSELAGKRLEVAVIPPDKGRNFCTLVTVGAGAYEMNGYFPKGSRNRAELVMLIPADKQDEAERYSEAMIRVAAVAGDEDSYLVPGLICDIYKQSIPELPYDSVMLISIEKLAAGSSICSIGGKAQVSFCQLFPVYESEAQYAAAHGCDEIVKGIKGELEAMGVFVSERKNTQKKYSPEKDNALMCEEIDFSEELASIGELCLCSRRIVNDGCKVGRMFRLNPFDAEVKLFSDNDSGWVFTEGNEETDYFANPNNLILFPLNTLVNLCYDVMPFLDNSEGTMVTRKADGKLHITASRKKKKANKQLS